MGTFIEKCFGFYQVREELEARISELEDENKNLAVKISGLENSNDQLWQAREKLKTENQKLTTEKEKLTKEKTEMERKMARLKRLEATDKSELDLQNRRFKSAIEDLKRQNRKLEE
ncbi:hypothetical protein FIM45_00300 [Helicobacter pylori]|nr:hypothetical protein FIM45_00300 [Helicobacter pylori]